jgi:hypothetical protein
MIQVQSNTMKIKPISFMLALVLGACVSVHSKTSAPDEARIKAEVETAFENLVSATKSGDHDLYFSFFEDASFTALSSNGTTLSTFDRFKQIYEPQLEAVQAYKTLIFDPVHIQVIDPNNAILTNEYKAELVLTSGDVVSASGAGAQFWSKSTGEWKLVHVSDAVKQ